MHKMLNFGQIPRLTTDLAARASENIVSSGFLRHFYSDLFNACR